MHNSKGKHSIPKTIGTIMFLVMLFVLPPSTINAQNVSNQPHLMPAESDAEFEAQINNMPSPRGALLRSLVVPGWGHHYIDKSNWNRGKAHLGADVVMLVSYIGLLNNINNLESSLITQANARAGINLKGQSRQIELAVSKFNSIDEYNDYQLRSRNWDKVIPKNSQTSWQWESTAERHIFQNTRDRISKSNNQIPALITLFVVNRVLSGINAFTRARDMKAAPEATLSYINEFGTPGITAKLTVGF